MLPRLAWGWTITKRMRSLQQETGLGSSPSCCYNMEHSRAPASSCFYWYWQLRNVSRLKHTCGVFCMCQLPGTFNWMNPWHQEHFFFFILELPVIFTGMMFFKKKAEGRGDSQGKHVSTYHKHKAIRKDIMTHQGFHILWNYRKLKWFISTLTVSLEQFLIMRFDCEGCFDLYRLVYHKIYDMCLRRDVINTVLQYRANTKNLK